MAQGAVTIKEVYAGAQTDTVVASPSTNKSLIIWGAIAETSAIGTTELKFATSGDKLLESEGGTQTVKTTNLGMEGAVNEDITITCPAGTTVIILFDEL
jgi:hypothetical protein